MNMKNLLSSFVQEASTQEVTSQQNVSGGPASSSALDTLASFIPGGLAGGAAAGGVMALLMGGKSTRKMAKKLAKYGGTAIVGGLAYKAYGSWQKNKALGQIEPITDQEIQQLGAVTSSLSHDELSNAGVSDLEFAMIKAMIAASKSDGQIDAEEHKRLFAAIERLNFDAHQKAAVFDAMAAGISIQEIASSVNIVEHKAEVYLAAYLAIDVDEQAERVFLNNLASGLDLPRGFPAYLEQQADQGVA